MLHFGEQDHIAGLQIFCAPRTGDEIDALGRSARENNFVGIPGIDEFGRPCSRRFKRRRGAIAQFMDAAMDVGVVVLVVMNERVDHRSWFLRGRRVVEIDQRLAMDLLVEDGKILAQLLPINWFSGTHLKNLTTDKHRWTRIKIKHLHECLHLRFQQNFQIHLLLVVRKPSAFLFAMVFSLEGHLHRAN